MNYRSFEVEAMVNIDLIDAIESLSDDDRSELLNAFKEVNNEDGLVRQLQIAMLSNDSEKQDAICSRIIEQHGLIA